jgi:hypothetical protein
MGSEDKFFLMSGCTHSSLNQVIWWRNNKVIPLKRGMGPLAANKSSTKTSHPHDQQISHYEIIVSIQKMNKI